jgi:hypothetical protein
MSKYKKKIYFSREIIFNKQGQIIFKKRFISRVAIKFYRFISGGS